MDAKLLVLLLMIGGVVFAVIKIKSPRRRSGPNRLELAMPRMGHFFQATGYAYIDMRQAPLNAQVDRWAQAERASILNNVPEETQLVRNYQGLEVSFRRYSAVQDRTITWAQSWWTPPLPIGAPFHIVHRAMLQDPRGRPNNWQPAFPNTVLTGDPEFDQRFIVFSPVPPQRIQQILLNPRLRAALLQCAYVDLRVLPDRVVFSDPVGLNISALVAKNQLAELVTTPGREFEVGLPVHDRIADILLGASSLAR